MTNKRAPDTLWLSIILIFSPTATGVLGGLLIAVGGLISNIAFGRAAADGEALLVTLSFGFFGAVFGVFFSYIGGLPYILGGWAVTHFLTPRRTLYFVGAFAVAGMAYAYSFFGFRYSPTADYNELSFLVRELIPIISGAISGGATGALISAVGYRSAPKPA